MKRTYSKDFKIKACELVLKEENKNAVVAEKLGINKIMERSTDAPRKAV